MPIPIAQIRKLRPENKENSALILRLIFRLVSSNSFCQTSSLYPKYFNGFMLFVFEVFVIVTCFNIKGRLD